MDSETVSKFLTTNIVPPPDFPKPQKRPDGWLEQSIKDIQSQVYWATYRDDSDEAILLWTAWHLVRHAIGHGVGDDPKADWRDEVWKCMRRLDES